MRLFDVSEHREQIVTAEGMETNFRTETKCARNDEHENKGKTNGLRGGKKCQRDTVGRRWSKQLESTGANVERHGRWISGWLTGDFRHHQWDRMLTDGPAAPGHVDFLCGLCPRLSRRDRRNWLTRRERLLPTTRHVETFSQRSMVACFARASKDTESQRRSFLLSFP